MCIDFDGHHSGGSSFVHVNDFCYYRNYLYTNRYKFSSKKKNRQRVPVYSLSSWRIGNRGVTVPLHYRVRVGVQINKGFVFRNLDILNT